MKNKVSFANCLKRNLGKFCVIFYFLLRTRSFQERMLKCNECVYTQMLKQCLAKEFLVIVKDFAGLE
ncbi:hypothetical protein [Campylobacter troglodytis]|uniref:hypothetical protein n=1 Tax=Campylobacter troglodytis TaxID=654363 RepID=UPI00115843DE|nr:hypothetical protein [Campylobacter troglodytis]TQR61550.1 hypothetical protein DMC01_00850 [Campylobacter troglodytis]